MLDGMLISPIIYFSDVHETVNNGYLDLMVMFEKEEHDISIAFHGGNQIIAIFSSHDEEQFTRRIMLNDRVCLYCRQIELEPFGGLLPLIIRNGKVVDVYQPDPKAVEDAQRGTGWQRRN